eukprot:g75097.t1
MSRRMFAAGIACAPAEEDEQGQSVQRDFDFSQLHQLLKQDKANFYKNKEEPMRAYQQVMDRAYQDIQAYFKTIPKAKCKLLPVQEAAEEKAPPAFYMPPAADGSRPGLFFVNLYKPTEREAFMSECIGLHEGVPGHHLQLAIASELKGLPRFRKHNETNMAYMEGWGLYCESLGEELPSFYKDELQLFGRLNAEIWRATRLVVDTGLHALGWSRQQAIDYMCRNTFLQPVTVEQEVDRYIAFPGQALTYKVGERVFQKIRHQCMMKLGARFHLPSFHDALLNQGAVPLSVLEASIPPRHKLVDGQRAGDGHCPGDVQSDDSTRVLLWGL